MLPKQFSKFWIYQQPKPNTKTLKIQQHSVRKRPPVKRLSLSKSQEIALISAARKIQSIAGQNSGSSKPFKFQFPAQAHSKVVGQVGGPNISFPRGNIQTVVFQEYKHQVQIIITHGHWTASAFI
ncbi:unnamed protein product [Cuscuta campestris]|uniref:Uncharacterized protein n=1 Tax=Cuscuta campestris TaxID=132261 RepID=A0A484KYW2_9ASTE|nr:unnamed protein product [Cuscuta campestris]